MNPDGDVQLWRSAKMDLRGVTGVKRIPVPHSLHIGPHATASGHTRPTQPTYRSFIDEI